MDEKTAIRLITDGNLSKKEILNILKLVPTQNVDAAAIASPVFSDKEKYEFAVRWTKPLWKEYLLGMNNKSDTRVSKLLKRLARQMTREEFVNLCSSYFAYQNFKNRRSVIEFVNKLIGWCPKKRHDLLILAIRHLSLLLNCVSPFKDEAKLLNIGFKNPGSADLWDSILQCIFIQHLTTRQITRLLAQKEIARINKLKLLRVSRFSSDRLKKEILKLPKGIDSCREEELLAEIFKFGNIPLKDAQEIARKKRFGFIWSALLRCYGALAVEQGRDLFNLLKYSKNEQISELIIKKMSPRYMKFILTSKKATVRMLCHILSSGRLSKEDCFEGLKYNWYVTAEDFEPALWASFFKSSLLTDTEILDTVKNITGKAQLAWQQAARTIDLKKLSLEALIVIGDHAEDDEIWKLITETVIERR